MDRDRTRQLEAVMERMSNGDASAVWTLVNSFEVELRGVARRQLMSMGRGDLMRDDSLIAGLLLDIGLLLFGTSAWRPGGALPWVWADLAIRRLVGATIGHRAASVEEQQAYGHEIETHTVRSGPDKSLDDLAVGNKLVAKLREAISLVASPRDQVVHIEYQTQKADGDPSPSHTVADKYGVKPDNVRQIDRRTRLKLRRLIERDSKFRDLKDLPWLA